MKQRFLLKMVLVAAGLFMGLNGAWADDVYDEVYSRAVNEWVNDDKTDWNASGAVEINATNGLGANANLTATYVSKSFSIKDNAKVKYVVDWTFATATGRDNNWNWIQFGDFLRIAINSTYNMQVSTDAGANWNGTVLGYYSNGTYTKTIELIFDTKLKTVEYFSFDGTDRTSLVKGTYNGKTFNTVSTGFVRGGRVTWTLANYITAITVSQAEQAASEEATYTINYKLGNIIVKSVEGVSSAGVTIEAEKAIDGEGTYEGNHYLITATEIPSIVLQAGANELNVPVRVPYTATLNVTTSIAGVAGEPEVINLTETDDKDCSWAYTYPYYVESESVYYVADETTSFGFNGTFTDGQVINKSVSYTNADNTVIYYGEPNQTTKGTDVNLSNGNTGYITGGVVYSDDRVIRLGTLPAGVYKLTVKVTGDANRNVVLGDCSDTTVFPTAIVTFTTTGLLSEIFTLTEDTPISISGKDQGNGKFNQSSTLDYILLQKIGDEIATITAAKYATFIPTMKVAVPDGVTAYYVTNINANGKARMESVPVIPANKAVILYKDVNEDTEVPFEATDAPEVILSNILNYSDAETVADGTQYILAEDGGVVGFYKAAGTIPARKAYLVSPVGANFLSFCFDDETTGIEKVENAAVNANGTMFNLAGQRVAQPTKGLYIVNGKKVVVK